MTSGKVLFLARKVQKSLEKLRNQDGYRSQWVKYNSFVGGAPSSRSYSSEPGPSTSRQTDAARLRRGGALHFIMYQCENISVILINAGIFQ